MSVNSSPSFNIAYNRANQHYLVQEEGKQDKPLELDEGEMNAVLQRSGLKVQNGRITTLDGVDPTKAGLRQVAQPGSAPQALDLNSGGLSPRDLVGHLGTWTPQTMTGGALALKAALAMARSAEEERALSRDLFNSLRDQVLKASEGEIKNKESQLEAERNAAWTEFGIAMAGAVVTFGLGGYGAKGGGALSFGAQSAAQGIGSAIQAGGKATDKEAGYQREADELSLDEKRWSLMKQRLEQAVEDARSGKDEANDQRKLALKVILDSIEMDTRVVEKASS